MGVGEGELKIPPVLIERILSILGVVGSVVAPKQPLSRVAELTGPMEGVTHPNKKCE